MKKQRNFKSVVITSKNYNSDGYYLIRVPVTSLNTALQSENRLTEDGMAVKEILMETENRKGKISVLYYIFMPHYVELLIYAKHDRTVKDKNALNLTVCSFMEIFKRLTEKKAGKKLWQEVYHCHRIKGGRELNRLLSTLGKGN
ncbi:MAG: hypothetical protein E7490_04255 [Ruminococcaceae bacterium]|nr:hypothetical protein [Oscillospiraceae bacterium]